MLKPLLRTDAEISYAYLFNHNFCKFRKNKCLISGIFILRKRAKVINVGTSTINKKFILTVYAIFFSAHEERSDKNSRETKEKKTVALNARL